MAISPNTFSELILSLEGVDPDITGRILECFDAVDVEVIEEDEKFSYELEDSQPIERLSYYIDEYVDHCTEQIFKLFPKDEDAKIADAVLELFRKREHLDIFNKKALYIYIREIVDAKTPKITKITSKLYDIFKTGYSFYLEHGYVKFSS
jgi:hypothetical protein